MKHKVPTLDLLKTTRPTSRNESRTQQQSRISFRITSQMNTPRQTARQSQVIREMQQSFFQNDMSNLKSKHRKTKTETDALIFWDQVENFGHVRLIEPPKFNQEKQAQLYQKLRQMKREQEEKKRKQQEAEEQKRMLELERKKKEQMAIEMEKKRMLDSQRYQEYLAEKYKIDRRFSFFTIVNAMMLRNLHSKPTSFKLAKLIATQYLNLLNYKAILHRITMQKSQPLEISQILSGNAEQLAQLKTIQHRLNEGLILRRKQTRIFLQKPKNIMESSNNNIQFSEPVLKRIRFLQACFRLKVFKLNKKNVEPKVKVKQNKAPPNRVRALKKRLDDIDFIKANSPSLLTPLSSPHTPVANPLGLFCTLYRVADKLKNYDRIKTQKMIQKTNEYLMKRVQSLYYPMIRYVSIFYQNVVVWSIQYSDITLDRTCIVLFFKGEGRHRYFYRLDIPIGAINKEEIEEQNCITVWPTVRDYLMSYLEIKGQLALLNSTKYGFARFYKLNFIQGLSTKSRKNITDEDINAIVETKEILNYLQTSQIVRVRKIFGSVYELLPQFQDCNLLSDTSQYIFNLPLVHDTILQLRMQEQLVLDYSRNVTKNPQDLRPKYESFLESNKHLINQILCFRFVHNNSQFFQDQMLEDVYELSHKSVYVQCAAINIQDILNHYDFQICNQISKFSLISMHLTLKSQFHFDDLLYNAIKHEARQGFQKINNFFDVDYSRFSWKFKKEFFKVRIEVTVFERDKSLRLNEKTNQDISVTRNERAFQPLKLNLEDFCKLGQALQETTFNNGEIQQCDFDQILKDILFEKSVYSQAADIVLRNAFTLDIKHRKIIIQPKYLHILSKTHNFIQKMDHQSLYNKIDSVFKYSVYPTEQNDLRRGYQNREKDNAIVAQLPFNQLFQDINQIDMRVTLESRKIELVTDYAFEFHDQWIDHRKQSFVIKKYQSFKMGNKKFLFVNFGNSMKVIYIKYQQSPIIIHLNDQHLINQISNCQRMNSYQKKQILTGIIRVIYSPTSFLYLKDNLFFNYLKAQLPNYHQIKVLLVSNSKKLLQYLDRLDFIYILKLWNNQQCYVHVKVYIVQHKCQTIGSEKIYIYDGEHLFVSVELYEFNSKLKKYILLFNKHDLEVQFDVERYFDSNVIFQWCKTIISNTKFDKRFLYRVPQIMKYNPNSSPVSHQRQMLNSYFSRQQSINVNPNDKTIRCTFNEFPRNNFDQNFTDKNYLNTVHRVFRVIGHYIEKFYLIKKKNKKRLVNEIEFKESKNFKLIKQEFVLISILAHTQLDMFQVIYYFPKSKRRLMTYLNILQIQEMNFQDQIIFDMIDSAQFSDFKDLQHQQESKGNPKRHVQLDMKLIQKLKLIKKEESPFDLQSAKSKKKLKSKIGFAQVSNEILMKNKVIKQAISQNNQISKNVMKLLHFTRKLHNVEDNHLRQIEISIWQKLLNQVFLLNLEHDKKISNSNSLMDKLIETFEDASFQKIRIIGKEHLMKRQSLQNSRYNYKVQTELTQKFRTLIIDNKVRVTQQFKVSQTGYIVTTNFQDYPIMEFLCSAQFRVERLGSAYVECFLESLNNRQTDVLKPLIPIPYSSSSNYNIYFRYYCLNNYFFKDVRVNLRELLNLFIADGFFKSQTNYMNSKLSISDMNNMCYYLTYKIKTQNYMNLSQLALQHQETEDTLRKYIITESVDQMQIDKKKDGEGFIYSEVIKKRNKQFILLQLQLFQSSHKVIVNVFENSSEYFQQKELTFNYIFSVVPNFSFLIKMHQYFKALQRLAHVLRQKQ